VSPEVVDCSGLFLCPASLHCNIPSQLDTSLRRRRARIPEKSFEQKVLESPSAARGDLESNEAEVRSAADPDSFDYLLLLRSYRSLSEWDRVIALAQDAPPRLA
jgi:hypothetical protein